MTDIRLPRKRSPAMRRLLAAAALMGALGLAHANDTPVTPPTTGELRAGEFVWTPQLAPRGPVLIVVSLLEQQAYVYRNGIRIGMSSVSTGQAGYETPTGVFSILQKRREHYSNLYDNAPMPYMQRLTWDGIALHAGKVPGYPASHGCIRLPYAFSEKLFGITTHGMTVAVTASISGVPVTASPGLFSPRDGTAVADEALPRAMPNAPPWSWRPERSPVGPLNLLLSTRDQQIVVLRNGIEIGWAPVEFRDAPLQGTYVYTLLEGSRPEPSPVVADRPALRWLAVPISGSTVVHASRTLQDAATAGRPVIPQAFARHVYDQLAPGATLVVTDEPIRGQALVLPATLLEALDPHATNPVEPGG